VRLGLSAPLVLIGFLLIAFPWRSLSAVGLFAALAAASVCTAAVAWTLARGMVLATTLLTAYTLVYLPGLGDAVADGVARLGALASPGSVAAALLSLGLFAALVGVVARRIVERAAARSTADPARARRVEIGVIAFFVIVLASAIAAGRITYWAGDRAPEAGGLDHMYPPMLFVLAGMAAMARIDRRGQRARHRRTLRAQLSTVGLGVLALLVFVLQSRRVMLACALMLGVAWFAHLRAARRAIHLPMMAVAAVTALMLLGSSGWRSVEDDAGLAERIDNVFSTETEVAVSAAEERLTYLWFDAYARDLAAQTPITIDPAELFASSVARAVPRALLPSKDAVPSVSCESPMQELGYDEDMPCTPQTEAWMAGGLLGLMLAGLLWGAWLGLCERLVARGGLSRVFGLLAFSPLIELEAGVFPMVQGLRLALIGTASAGVVVLALEWAGKSAAKAGGARGGPLADGQGR